MRSGVAICAFSFNRTSMESKLFFAGFSDVDGSLLIEPVWNRNRIAYRVNEHPDLLLIEPVWNRN